MNVHIRPMGLADLEAIAQLEKRIFVDAWSRDSFRAEVEDKDYSYPLVLEADGRLAGYAVVWYYLDELHIANIAIHPDFRRRGLARLLLGHILKKFSEARFAFLEVRRSNQAAINLYRHFGFKTLQVRKAYYRDGEDALVMVKDLRNSN